MIEVDLRELEQDIAFMEAAVLVMSDKPRASQQLVKAIRILGYLQEMRKAAGENLDEGTDGSTLVH
jgi:hypothetical protein